MTNEKISSISLDVTRDGLKDAAFIDYLDKHDIIFSVLTWDGPGGGNPEVEFQATRKKLINFLRDCYFDGEGNDEDIEYFSTLIVD